MTAKAASFGPRGLASSSSDETADALRRRLQTAEEDTQQLMQQLEEMGFSASSKERIVKSVENSDRPKTKEETYVKIPSDSQSRDKESHVYSYYNKDSRSNTSSQSQGIGKDSQAHASQSKPGSNSGSEKSYSSSKSAKHRPITPLSLRGIAMPGSLEGQESKTSDSYVARPPRSFDGGSRRRSRSEVNEEKGSIGRQELEQELIRVKRIMSQLEEELQCEMEGRQKAKEEAEKLRGVFDDITSSRAELEMKVEELNSAKQKLMRRTTELKEEVTRESSLRASLEESHTTLLGRLQDMESVIESLRAECKTHTAGSSGLKAEVVKLKDELAQETLRRQRIEDNYHIVITEKDKLMLNANSAQSENQRFSQELSRLQTQYTELIKQLEHTQSVVDNLTASKKSLEEEKSSLQSRVQSLTSDLDKLRLEHGDSKESETRLAAERTALEADFGKLRTEKEKLMKENFEKKRKIDNLEHELKIVKQSLAQKNQEFTSAADGLEVELAALKNQLETMESEKQHVLKDKESLLEEVNQTVDTLMSERSRLQTELQASCVEAESLRTTCSRLEQDKAQLLERLGGLQHQQTTQRKVEDTLNEMMEQKNKLAYENGKLQSAINQLRQELEEVSREQGDITQLRKLSQSLQAKYTKSQQEISEYKIALQRLEGQTKMAMEELEQKDHHMKMAQARKDEAEREMGKLLAQLEVLEGSRLHKVSHYEKNMEEAKSVNKEIAGTLEAVMTSHSQLQNIVENLQVELGKRDSQISQLKSNRNKEQNEMNQELRNFEEKMEATRAELKKEREKTGKKTAKELSEMRKQSENLSSRNQELVKANTELRQKMADMEREKDEMKTKISGQRHKLDYLHKAKKQLEDNLNKMKAVREDIEELERMRDEYMQKNREQGETISTFISQISSLQDEMRQLASAHTNTQHLLKLKEEALEKERRIRDEMKKRYSETKKREMEVSRKFQSSDDRLKEVHSESLEISKHLQEASDWFKGKFDKLQTELSTSKQIQAKLERENTEQRRSLEVERSKAQDAAERAKEMIQNSRQTISRLADYAEVADTETKQQLARLRSGLHTTTHNSKLTMMDLET